MPRFEKYRDAHALAEISRKLKSGELLCEKQEENIHHHVEMNREPLPGKQSQPVSSEIEGGDPSSPEDDLAQQQHSPDESSSDSSSAAVSSSPSASSSEEREEEEEEGSDIEQQQHDEFIDDDVMAMLETHAEKEKNDINACLYAIDYVLSRS